MKNILVAVDLSPKSHEVLKRASLLAKEFDAKITALHVIDISLFEKALCLIQECVIINDETIKTKLTHNLTQMLNSENFDVVIKKGSSSREIVALADEIDADLIVIGNHNKDSGTLLGSTSEKVIQHSKKATLIVKNSCHEDYKTVLFPTDLSEKSLNSIRNSKFLKASHDITILNSYSCPTEFALNFYGIDTEVARLQEQIKTNAKNALDSFSNSLGVDLIVDTVEALPNIGQSIIDYANSKSIELIILNSNGLIDIGSLMVGSTSAYIIRESKSDILVTM